MDPYLTTMLMAIAGGACGKAGEQLFSKLGGLLRAPLRHESSPDTQDVPLPNPGEDALSALRRTPKDLDSAEALKVVLAERCAVDEAFRVDFEEWIRNASDVCHARDRGHAAGVLGPLVRIDQVVNLNLHMTTHQLPSPALNEPPER